MSALTTFAIVVAIFKYGWPFFILAAMLISYFKNKKWPVQICVWEKRGENIIFTEDRGQAYKDPYTGLVGYKLQKAKDTIPAIDYKWIMHTNKKPIMIIEKLLGFLRPTQGTLFLYKYGAKQYKPVQSGIGSDAPKMYKEIMDEKGNEIIIDQYQQFDPRGTLEALTFEVVDWDNMNFMVQEMRASFERRQKQNNWMKTIMVPLAILAVSAMISIIMIKFSADWRPPATAGPAPNNNPNVPIIGDLVTPGQ